MRLAFAGGLGVAVFLVAAWLWARASQQPPPGSFDLRIRESADLDDGLQNWVRSSARANSWAARSSPHLVTLEARPGSG